MPPGFEFEFGFEFGFEFEFEFEFEFKFALAPALELALELAPAGGGAPNSSAALPPDEARCSAAAG